MIASIMSVQLILMWISQNVMAFYWLIIHFYKQLSRNLYFEFKSQLQFSQFFIFEDQERLDHLLCSPEYLKPIEQYWVNFQNLPKAYLSRNVSNLFFWNNQKSRIIHFPWHFMSLLYLDIHIKTEILNFSLVIVSLFLILLSLIK